MVSYYRYRITDIVKTILGDEKMCHGYEMHRHHCMMYERNFITTEEKIEHLEEYKKSLENEIKGVDELIKKLNKAS
jgi:hypothetical protein